MEPDDEENGSDEVVSDRLPNPARIGLVSMEPGEMAQHYCFVCGAWGSFGYPATRRDPLGEWYCMAHRPPEPEPPHGRRCGED